MTREEFDKLYLDKVVHCDTEEKANHFLALADSVGYKWYSGCGLTRGNFWEEETYYHITNKGILFGNIKFPRRLDGFQIIEYRPKSKFKVGDKVRVKDAYTPINGKVGVIERVRLVSPMLYTVKVNVDDRLGFWYFYENQLEKVE